MKTKLFLLLACFIHFIAKANNDSTIVSSQLKNVVVYKSGAEMTHVSSATLKQGNNELIIDNISNQLDINSVQIKTGSSVTIMGIEFSNNYLVTPEETPHTKLLEDSINKVQKRVDDAKLLLSNSSELLAVLMENRNIKGTQNGVSVSELIKLMDYYKMKSWELQTTIAHLTERKEKDEAIISIIQDQIDEEEKKNTTTSGRLILQLSCATSGKFNFTISYITPNAYWTPFYDVRVDDIKTSMKIIYKAKIIQTTGIDWKQVKLSLSTSLPSQWGKAPEFDPWFLSYIDPVVVMDKSLDEVAVVGYETQRKKDLTGAIANVSIAELLNGKVAGVQITDDSNDELKVRGGASITQNNSPLYIVNGTVLTNISDIDPQNIKSVKVLKDASATAVYGARGANGVVLVTLKDGLEDHISVSDNTLDLSFDIDIPYDVPTNGKAQTATLQTLNVPAIYNDYAAPKLDKEVYLLAQIPAWEKLNLLPGEASIIVDNTYIGRSFIDPASTSDTLNLTLGRDKRIVIKREKITDFSSVKFLGSNKLEKFTYEITVKNTKKDTANISVKDQFPISTNKEIVVQLVEQSNAEVNNETGLLTWKLALAPGESKKLRFTYSVLYPKDKRVF